MVVCILAGEATAQKAKTPAVPATPPASANAAPEPIGNPGDWFPPESYPAEAKIAAEEGRTEFSLDIDDHGRIMACNILISSGSELLDSQTCSQLIANGRFKPAVDGQGHAVAGKWQSSMRWQLLEGGGADQ